MSYGERHLAAIMYTDMVGYTALGQRNESLSLTLVEEQRKIIRPALARHNGREIKTIGDAFLVEFANALDALRCAYDIQRATREFNIPLPEDKRIYLRVGLHLGDVVESEGDISGDAVNVASRIEPLAEDGGVCLTRQVYESTHNKFELPLVSTGEKTLKNVSQPMEVYKMEMPWEKADVSPQAKLDPRRIAVLPFASMSPDSQDEYFADGMTEELITAMSGIQGLQVIARTSVMNYKGEKTKLSIIGNELRVGTVLEGSVRKAGNRVRVTAQLIDVPTESHLWSEKYDRELDDIFRIQDDIARKISEALRLRLAKNPEPAPKHAENIEAYTLYLRGRTLWNSRDRESVLASLKLFQEAIKIDPDYARAWAGLADAYNIATSYGFMDSAEGLSKSKDAAMKSLELDDSLAEAHASLGAWLDNGLRFQEAQREYEKAVELNPSYATARQWNSEILLSMGRKEEALEQIERARELDPLSPIISLSLGWTYFLVGRVDDAIAILDKLVEREPTFARTYASRSGVYASKGMIDRAYADLGQWHELVRDEDGYKARLVILDLWFGKKERAPSVIDDLISEVGKSSVREWAIAICYALIGNRDEFFKWIDEEISARVIYPGNLRYDPVYDNMREDRRFPEIFKKLGLPY